VEVTCTNCATTADVQALASQVAAQATVQAQSYYALAAVAESTRHTHVDLVWTVVMVAGLLLCLLAWRLLSVAFGGLRRPIDY
jgi:hypothetical protein